ncbi:Squalene-hopene cyclase C-terminal domain-containing protein [Thermomonospora echinospora]|uniref:Squalene-hopene cyclase C-terminal domain-containing protein n=1 Tax=Thermomonospora echinospora TaxID=1992 RepID=A0A1H5VKU3_9ACTN|nr:prenyltransferase/squalene oxidase repeat-containing protein [Thermomonospora echinospora]SEF87874.1 Squalene-hopene cyclase C-terminal domain-containing protein [Thermomonospora echinospora]
MTIDGTAERRTRLTDHSTDHPADPATTARRLVAGLTADPLGRISPSVYETARLVTLAPWLTGHSGRVFHLLAAQRADGHWVSAVPGYTVAPTLSATEALLGLLRAPGPWPPGVTRDQVAGAADRGLRALLPLLDGERSFPLPDMPAIEHLSPALIELVNGHLDVLEPWRDGPRLRPSPQMSTGTAAVVRDMLRRGEPLPGKMLHALELAGPAARAAASVTPEPTGSIGASPASVAAWLGDRDPGPGGRARRFLESVTARHRGPVPSVVPITVFERAWTVSWLARSGVPLHPPPELAAFLRASLGPAGTGGGSGLPSDADTSSGVLYALSLLGIPHPPDFLWQYETDTHFCTWQGENGLSVGTNSHALEAFGSYLHGLEASGTGVHRSATAEQVGRYAATIRKISAWLCEQQQADGSWSDRWHASPYYGTACAAPALAEFGGPESAAAVDRAVAWVLATQRPDGSWGLWEGTAEETAYAVRILLLSRASDARAVEAARRGGAYLRAVTRADGTMMSFPPLWHDKDLYTPLTIVQAAVLAALHLTRPGGPVPFTW